MGLLNNPKPTVYVVTAFVIAFVAALALNKCHAANLGPTDAPFIQFDAGSTIIRGITPIVGLTFAEPASVLPHSYWQESLNLIGSSKFGNINAPNNMILSGLFVPGFGRFDLGLGVSWMANYYPYNGQNVNFTLQAAYRFVKLPITLTYRHYSDAGMTAKNIGRDTVLIGWRF